MTPEVLIRERLRPEKVGVFLDWYHGRVTVPHTVAATRRQPQPVWAVRGLPRRGGHRSCRLEEIDVAALYQHFDLALDPRGTILSRDDDGRFRLRFDGQVLPIRYTLHGRWELPDRRVS